MIHRTAFDLRASSKFNCVRLFQHLRILSILRCKPETQIEQTQRRIAQILTQLESATLSNENRVVLQSRLNEARLKLTGLRESLRSTRAEAATSTVNVTLTTEEIEAVPIGGSRLDGIKDVLAWEAIAVLYTLVVAGPFIVLGVLVWVALRLRRRQVETRLLEQN